jgi:GNAT superfamily N-acetyltransferase
MLISSAVAFLEDHGVRGRQDANWEHVLAFRNASMQVQRKHFDSVFRHNQIHLAILGTHPDFRHRGFATALCRWGMDQARKNNIAVTVVASPMGYELLAHLNFTLRGTKRVQVPGEKEKLTIYAVDYVTQATGAVHGEFKL